jgi:hypothetical protein
MRKMAVILPIFAVVLLWTMTAGAQQQPMPSRSAKYESLQLGDVVWELGEPSGGKVPVTWKADLSNADAKDHTTDLQVRFLDAQGGELFHDSVRGNKVPAKGTVTVSNTATVEAAKAESIKSTQVLIRARR